MSEYMVRFNTAVVKWLGDEKRADGSASAFAAVAFQGLVSGQFKDFKALRQSIVNNVKGADRFSHLPSAIQARVRSIETVYESDHTDLVEAIIKGTMRLFEAERIMKERKADERKAKLKDAVTEAEAEAETTPKVEEPEPLPSLAEQAIALTDALRAASAEDVEAAGNALAILMQAIAEAAQAQEAARKVA